MSVHGCSLPELPLILAIILEIWMKRKKRWVLVQSSRTAEWASVTSFFWSLCLDATARHSTCRHHSIYTDPQTPLTSLIMKGDHIRQTKLPKMTRWGRQRTGPTRAVPTRAAPTRAVPTRTVPHQCLLINVGELAVGA